MALGYEGKLYILAFDHRGSFQKKMFGIEGDPTPEETDRISDAKKLIFEGMELAVKRGVDAEATGVLVDEQFGSDIPQLAREHGLKLAMPVPKPSSSTITRSRVHLMSGSRPSIPPLTIGCGRPFASRKAMKRSSSSLR